MLKKSDRRVPASQVLTAERLQQGVAELSARDPALARVVKQNGLPPMWVRPRGYETLVKIILEQQVSQLSAAAIYRRLQAAVGEVTPATIAAAGVEGLRAAGLTRQKAAYCVGLADKILSGEVDLARIARFDDAEARAALINIPGIGPWSADIYLLMALRRPDVWPHGDLALVKAAMQVLRLRKLPTQDRLARLAREWSPWRAVAARILWHHYLSSR